jgi:two-component system OmpR family sensor kinase
MTLRTRLGVAGGLVLAVLVRVGVLRAPHPCGRPQVDEVDRQLRPRHRSPWARPRASDRPAARLASPRSRRSATSIVARIDPGAPRIPTPRGARPGLRHTEGREPELARRAPIPANPSGHGGIGRGLGVVAGDALPGPGARRPSWPCRSTASTPRPSARRWRSWSPRSHVLLAMRVAGWWLLRLGLRPIAEVTQVADAIAAATAPRRVRGGAPGTEGAPPGPGLQRHAGRAGRHRGEAAPVRRRRSHELRTPSPPSAGSPTCGARGPSTPTSSTT